MATRNLNFQSRMSAAPGAGGYGGGSNSNSNSSASSSQVKQRQLAQLNAQLSILQHNLSNTQELVRVTAVQADHMRVLGSWHGGAFMAASRVLGEESVSTAASAAGSK
ncbi:hypothetical protein MKZ38_001269 [Zalerion maritima]|uniref:Uncharacterized protein n=1 Tax=Zalerion maritima TaxID=339359 RepID=A0AAD5RQG5_9PEZI|nr:hypothetical protein MKZ38_001269 [Zalerion maritima]